MLRDYTISPPFIELPGDTYVKDGHFIEQRRGPTLVDSRDLRLMANTIATQPIRIGPTPVTRLILEDRNPMDAATATVITVNKSGDNYNFQYADGSGAPRTVEQLQTEYEELQNPEMAQKIQRVMAFKRSNGGADMSSQNGVCCTVDYQATNPVSFSE